MEARILADRYEVERSLGSGGAGELLLVRDLKGAGERYALKILRPRRADPGLGPLFRSEFLLLSSLQHDSIVRVRDFGVLPQGEPFFTMDFVEGEDARVLFKEERFRAREFILFTEAILRALAYLHARGILHRDIKPANILLRQRGERPDPVLVDFGLATTETREGEASGTLPYIAPEVIAGAGPDGRADLFALGVTLYEICTGRAVGEREEVLRAPAQVFSGERVRRNMRQWARPGVPRRFEEFVARLLAPVPAARYASAAAALEGLSSLYGDAVGSGAVESAKAIRGEPPLVGRSGALELLLQRARALLDGELLDPILVVAGRAGYGVSRLLATLRNHAVASGLVVASGREPVELLRELASQPGLSGASPPRGDARAVLFRLDTLARQVSQRRPVLLLLDDVHRLDEESAIALRDWVLALERQKGPARFALALGGRHDEKGTGAELLRTAGGSVPLELRELPPIEAEDVRSAILLTLGEVRPEGAFVQAIHRACDGSPRLLAEIFRILEAERVFDTEHGKPVIRAEALREVRLPKGAEEAARRRAERLPLPAQEALARLALVEGPLPWPAARAAAGEALDLLLSERILVRDGGCVRFPDELARKGCDTLRGKTRLQAAAGTARAIREAAPAAAASLLAAAGEVAEARGFGCRAALDLADAGFPDDAIRLLQGLLGEPPDLPTARALLPLLHARSRSKEGAALGFPLLRRPDADLDLALRVATCFAGAKEYGKGFEALRWAEARARPEEAARVINARAVLLEQAGRAAEALAESDRALAAAGGDLLALDGKIARHRATLLRGLGRRRAALAIEDAILGSPRVEPFIRTMSLVNRGAIHRAAGRTRRAIADFRAAIALGDAAGARVGARSARYRLGVQFVELGRASRALRLLESSRRAAEEEGAELPTGVALVTEALAQLAQGRPAEADSRLARAEALPSHESALALRSYAGQARARSLALAGRASDAAALLAKLLEAGPSLGEMEPALALEAAETRLVARDAEGAEPAFRAALRSAWARRARGLLGAIRVGLAECSAWRGAWQRADALLSRGGFERFSRKTPLSARALVVRAGAAIHRREFAAGGRLLEQSIRVANRAESEPVRAAVYESVAFLLEEVEMQRHLRRPTGPQAAILLGGARDIWATYGNDDMLRKIDLHLAELPRAAPGGASPESDRLVKILHVTREMNREFDRDRLLALILDRAIELTGAERGFIILLKDGREEVHLARNIDHEALNDPDEKLSSQIVRDVVRSGRIVVSADAASDDRFDESLSVRKLRLRSIIAVPFRSGGRTIGALYLDNRFKAGSFSENEERILELFSDQAVTAIEKSEMIRELEGKQKELEDLFRQEKQRLKSQGKELDQARREIRAHRKARGWGFERIVGRSVSMQGVVREAKRAAASEIPILLTGENGTGKELVARAIHVSSPRQAGPFLPVNCAAVSEGILEAELFGHVRGSFTGADRDRPGVFEEANGGTIFLDEVGDMPLSMQVKLLRVFESGEVRRVGEPTPRTVDVRVVSATNADLPEKIRAGAFREDLYYRICGLSIRIPPLRDRLEDVEPLARAFTEEAGAREGRPGIRLSNDAVARLESYNWPGNVRELRNVILRAIVSCTDATIGADHITFDTRGSTILPGFDPARADRVVAELATRGVALNERQQTAISRVLTRGQFGFSEYLRLFKVSKSTTARDLDALVSGELLERRGKTRAVVYLAGPKLRELAAKVGAVGNQ